MGLMSDERKLQSEEGEDVESGFRESIMSNFPSSSYSAFVETSTVQFDAAGTHSPHRQLVLQRKSPSAKWQQTFPSL